MRGGRQVARKLRHYRLEVILAVGYAELQALERRPMTMRDWINKLDEFLKISGRERLTHGGKISTDAAREKAELEYARYRAWLDTQPRPVDLDFEKAVKQLQSPQPVKGKPGKRGAK